MLCTLNANIRNQIIEDTGSRRLISNDMHHVPSMSIPKMVDTALPEGDWVDQISSSNKVNVQRAYT